MTDLKEDFRKWLIKQGLSEKTKTGRPGTVYEYVRRIDNLSNLIYKGHDLQPWQQLAEDIYPILGFHLLCRKGDVHITQSNITDIKDFLDTFLSTLCPYQENLKNYFEVKLQLSDGNCIEQYTLIKDLLPSLTTQTLLLKFSDSTTQVNKNRNALEKFYQFLSETQYNTIASGHYKAVAEKTKVDDFYSDLTKKIQVIKSFSTNKKNPIFHVIIKAGTKTTPPQLSFGKHDTEESVANGIGEEEVLQILRITRWTLKRLVDKGMLHKNENNLYDMGEINKFIQDNFVSSVPDYAKPIGNAVEKWWTIEEVKEKTGRNERYIERLRENKKVSHINTSKRKYLFYPPDLAFYSKIKPLQY